MAGIQGKNTKPEMVVRRALHAAGFRYRLHFKGLPGKPDLVFPKYRTVIFVNGCFWHKHNCKLFKWPKTRPEFWRQKITGNVDRDKKNITILKGLGWSVITTWECTFKGKSNDAIRIEIDRLTEALLNSDQMHST